MRKVLIVVDMLNDFIDKKGALFIGPTGRDIIDEIAGKLEDARANGVEVLYLQDSHKENDKEFERFPKHCVAGTWGSEVIPELAPLDDEEVYLKTRYSGFFKTELDAVFDLEGDVEVDIVGCCTSICVGQTIAEMANRDNVKIKVNRKAVADFNDAAHNYHLDYQFPIIFGVEVL